MFPLKPPPSVSPASFVPVFVHLTPRCCAARRSFGFGCGVPKSYSVYTRVSAFASWLAQSAPGLQTAAPAPPPGAALVLDPPPFATVCETARFGLVAVLDCGAQLITAIDFASFGNPTGAPDPRPGRWGIEATRLLRACMRVRPPARPPRLVHPSSGSCGAFVAGNCSSSSHLAAVQTLCVGKPLCLMVHSHALRLTRPKLRSSELSQRSAGPAFCRT